MRGRIVLCRQRSARLVQLIDQRQTVHLLTAPNSMVRAYLESEIHESHTSASNHSRPIRTSPDNLYISKYVRARENIRESSRAFRSTR